jgi:hypothetical protein
MNYLLIIFIVYLSVLYMIINMNYEYQNIKYPQLDSIRT